MKKPTLNLNQVVARTKLTRQEIEQAIDERNFPSPIPLGPCVVGWVERDVEDWLRLIEKNHSPD